MKTKDRIKQIMGAASPPSWETIEERYQSTATANWESAGTELASYPIRELEAVRPMGSPEQRAAIEIELIGRELADELQPARQLASKIAGAKMRIRTLAEQIKGVEKVRKPLLARITTDQEAKAECLKDEVRRGLDAMQNAKGGGDNRPPAVAEALGRLKDLGQYSGPLTEKEAMTYLEGLHKEQAELTKAIEAVEPLTSDEAATLNTTGREMQKMQRSREDLEATIAELKREQPDPQDAIDSALVRAWATMESLGVNPEPAAATA